MKRTPISPGRNSYREDGCSLGWDCGVGVFCSVLVDGSSCASRFASFGSLLSFWGVWREILLCEEVMDSETKFAELAELAEQRGGRDWSDGTMYGRRVD